MLHDDIVETSRRMGETRGRTEKVGALAACLRQAEPAAIETAVATLQEVAAMHDCNLLDLTICPPPGT